MNEEKKIETGKEKTNKKIRRPTMEKEKILKSDILKNKKTEE